MVNIEEEYQELLAELGTPFEQEAMPAEEISYVEGRLPPRLVQFLHEAGHSIFLDGAVIVCKPSELAPVLALKLSPLRTVKNIQKVRALEHFAILAQMQLFYLANVGINGVQKVRHVG